MRETQPLRRGRSTGPVRFRRNGNIGFGPVEGFDSLTAQRAQIVEKKPTSEWW
jgi:hypothetical protein